MKKPIYIIYNWEGCEMRAITDYERFGLLAVHPHTNRHGYFTVTHLPSGCMIHSADTKHECKHVAKKLRNKFPWAKINIQNSKSFAPKVKAYIEKCRTLGG
jgi:hypothetical protein